MTRALTRFSGAAKILLGGLLLVEQALPGAGDATGLIRR